jgi:D-serine deaminase-like pyridoxal phosphate-dependent protein
VQRPLSDVETPDLETPALVVDLDRLTANVERMAAATRDQGLRLRPHAKTHKCLEVARLQLAAGAVGLTVATLSEAEVFAAGGCTDLFVAYPVHPTGAGAARLRHLLDSADLTVGVDTVAGAAALARAADGRPVRALIEIDSGQHRTGVPPADTLDLARGCRDLGLDVAGVFSHGGHAYGGPGDRPRAATEEGAALAEAADRLREAGFDVRTVSAGSTPTTGSPRPAQVTEERPGTYVFGDRQQLGLGACGPEDLAASVLATVVSVHADRFVVDAGSKVLAGDRPAWLTGFASVPALDDAPVTRLSEHHGVVDRGAATWSLPEVGERLLLRPNHVCTVVNLFDDYVVTRRGAVVDRWAVAARGRNT